MTVEEHLQERHLDVSLHRVWTCDETFTATFPFYNALGQLIGYQTYRPNSDKKKKNDEKGRYYTFFAEGQRGFWGLESWHLSETLFLLEGIFDACRLTARSASAVAVISNDPKHLRSQLRLFRAARRVVAVCDSDENRAGAKLAKYAHEAYFVQSGKDLGEASEEEVERIVGLYK